MHPISSARRRLDRPLLLGLALACGSVIGCSGGSPAPADAGIGPAATIQEETRPLAKPVGVKRP